jgi:hypothetical protein
MAIEQVNDKLRARGFELFPYNRLPMEKHAWPCSTLVGFAAFRMRTLFLNSASQPHRTSLILVRDEPAAAGPDNIVVTGTPALTIGRKLAS